MEEDRKTTLNEFYIKIGDNEKYLNELREKGKRDVAINDNQPEKLVISQDNHKSNPGLIVYDNGKIKYSGYLNSEFGDSYVSFSLPLSQGILFDILSETIKKFNKIKTVLEATK